MKPTDFPDKELLMVISKSSASKIFSFRHSRVGLAVDASSQLAHESPQNFLYAI